MDKANIVLTVVGIYFIGMIFIGFYAMKRNKKASDFLIAGRKVNLPMTALTLAAVQIGAGVVLGGAYNGSQMGVWPGMWYSLGCGGGLIVAGLIVAKKLRNKDGYVPMDFYERRYGTNKWVRLWAWISNVPSLLGIFIAQLLACGSILAGFGIPFYTGVIICAVVIMIYSTLGGMWGVVITDSVQVAIIAVGLPIIAIASLMLLPEHGFSIASVFATPFMPPGTFTKFIYVVVPFLIAISVSYDAYMRYQSAENDRAAVWGCVIAGVITIIIGTMASTVGAVSGLIFPGLQDGVFANMVITALNPVLAGIVISAVLAASMSSASCLLVSMGATFSRDLYNRFLHPESTLDDLKYSKVISRGVVGISAVLGILLSFKITNILDAIIIFNYPYMGSLLVPLLAGVLWKGATRRGTYAAMLIGGIIGVVSFLAFLPGPLNGIVNPDVGLLYAYLASTIVLVFISAMDKSPQPVIEAE